MRQNQISTQPEIAEIVRCGELHEQDRYDLMASFCRQRCCCYRRVLKNKGGGLNNPNDIAIMGFSNNIITSFVNPQLTTIDQPSFEMGGKSC
jgi:DNA-binding LacI/PurR family transcriptional regulator